MTVAEIARLLEKEYGPRTPCRRADPLSELVGTVLSQNTSDVNSHRAFAALRERFPRWEDVARADVAAIEQAIRIGGLGRIKAARIQRILRQIQGEKGSLDLSFLEHLPVPEARAWLRHLPGVGPKTAACVLLFALRKPAFPVDTHVHRVARRLGLIGWGVSAEKAHEALETLVPPELVYQLHLQLVEHGRRICKPRPLCQRCVLNYGCPYFLGQIAPAAEKSSAEGRQKARA